MNKMTNLYRMFFPSRENDRDEDEIRAFVQKEIQAGNSALNDAAVSQYMENPQFVEHKILNCILEIEKLAIDLEYLSIYRGEMNASSSSCEDDGAIILDELWSYTTLSFFLTVFSLAHDSGRENFSRCIKNCFVLLDLQGQKHKIGVHNADDVKQMASLPANIMDLAMDCFWIAWTFVIGHELYHLTAKDHDASSIQEELKADAYGYKILIDMIEAQKQGKIPEEIHIFYEDYYLAPVMLFEYFLFLDQYRSLCGEKVEYTGYPSPQQRQEQIWALFDEYLPDTFDTTPGNELLNHFLDAEDLLREQITLKKERGKLVSPEIEA